MFTGSGACTPGPIPGDQQHPGPRLVGGVQSWLIAVQSLLQEALKGAATQKNLVLSGRLPDYYWGTGSDMNATAKLLASPQFRGATSEQAAAMAAKLGGIILDFVPVVGDIKGFIEAQTPFDYTLAAVGILGPIGDGVAKALKEAKIAMAAGDATKALDKLNEAEKAAAELKTAGGTANSASAQALKEQLARENLANIAASDPRLSNAVNASRRDFSIGTGTVSESDKLGRVWVGDGARPVSNQSSCPGCLISADGTRIYRPPQPKSSSFALTGVQANFVQQTVDGKLISNGHLNVTP